MPLKQFSTFVHLIHNISPGDHANNFMEGVPRKMSLNGHYGSIYLYRDASSSKNWFCPLVAGHPSSTFICPLLAANNCSIFLFQNILSCSRMKKNEKKSHFSLKTFI